MARSLDQVIRRELASFSLEYACDGPSDKRWFLLLANPLPEKEADGAVVMHRDVTSLRQASEAQFGQATESAHVHEERLKDFAQASSEWFWEMDSAYRFTAIEGVPIETQGIEPEQSIGRTVQEIANSRDDEQKWRQFQEDLEARRPLLNFVYSRIDDAGRDHYLRINGAPFYDADGTFRGYRGAGSDISAQVKAADRRAAQAQGPRRGD